RRALCPARAWRTVALCVRWWRRPGCAGSPTRGPPRSRCAGWRGRCAAGGRRRADALGALGALGGEVRRLGRGLDRRVVADPENVERGLAQLVLTVIELLRQLMERQAVRRVEGGTLTDEEVERLGQTFLRLEQRMAELKE